MGTTPSTRPPQITAAQLNSRCWTWSGRPTTVEQRQAPRGLDDSAQPFVDRLEQGALVEQVIARVRRDSELGKQRHDRAFGDGALHEHDGFRGVERRVGHPQPGHADRNPCEIVTVEVEELLPALHVVLHAS